MSQFVILMNFFKSSDTKMGILIPDSKLILLLAPLPMKTKLILKKLI